MIVVGADTGPGEALIAALGSPQREIRVFISDEMRGLELKGRGFKVATGDVSDESHIEAASTRCFTAVLITEAAHDARERSFAATPDAVLRGWANAVANSAVTRVIWITNTEYPETDAEEVAVVDPGEAEFAKRVIELDDASSLT